MACHVRITRIARPVELARLRQVEDPATASEILHFKCPLSPGSSLSAREFTQVHAKMLAEQGAMARNMLPSMTSMT